MAMNCKGLCSIHPELFVNNRPQFKIGDNVYFCKLCDKYVEIKQIIKNSLFKFKNKCVCCKAKFRMKTSRSSRQNRKYCKCGCGERIYKTNRYSRNNFYILNHDKIKKEIKDRKCIKCNTNNTYLENYTGPKVQKRYPVWHKFGTKFLCTKCDNTNRYYIRKLKKILNELQYSAVMKII